MSQSFHPSSSAHRRRTDLMPTITFSSVSPGNPGSGFSRSSTPGGGRMLRSPGKAVSMSRLDNLSHLSHPRVRQQHATSRGHLHAATTHTKRPTVGKIVTHQTSPPSPDKRKMSKSMTHLGPKKQLTASAAKSAVASAVNKGKGQQDGHRAMVVKV